MFAVQRDEGPFWQARYYDFNVVTADKRMEKLRYMLRSPVKRGRVAEPVDWPWFTFRHYDTGVLGTVEIESDWTAAKRGRAARETHVSGGEIWGTRRGWGVTDVGHPPRPKAFWKNVTTMLQSF